MQQQNTTFASDNTADDAELPAPGFQELAAHVIEMQLSRLLDKGIALELVQGQPKASNKKIYRIVNLDMPDKSRHTIDEDAGREALIVQTAIEAAFAIIDRKRGAQINIRRSMEPLDTEGSYTLSLFNDVCDQDVIAFNEALEAGLPALLTQYRAGAPAPKDAPAVTPYFDSLVQNAVSRALNTPDAHIIREHTPEGYRLTFSEETRFGPSLLETPLAELADATGVHVRTDPEHEHLVTHHITLPKSMGQPQYHAFAEALDAMVEERFPEIPAAPSTQVNDVAFRMHLGELLGSTVTRTQASEIIHAARQLARHR